jgi:hypothetical protein
MPYALNAKTTIVDCPDAVMIQGRTKLVHELTHCVIHAVWRELAQVGPSEHAQPVFHAVFTFERRWTIEEVRSADLKATAF